MTNYHQVIILKMGLIILACLMIDLIPTNSEIQDIGNKMKDLENNESATKKDEK